MPFDSAGQIEFHQNHEDLSGMKPRMGNQLVHADRRLSKRLDQQGAIAVDGRRGAADIRWFGESHRRR